jgi:hypothetical protein
VVDEVGQDEQAGDALDRDAAVRPVGTAGLVDLGGDEHADRGVHGERQGDEPELEDGDEGHVLERAGDGAERLRPADPDGVHGDVLDEEGAERDHAGERLQPAQRLGGAPGHAHTGNRRIFRH